jgi:hypothetical protein
MRLCAELANHEISFGRHKFMALCFQKGKLRKVPAVVSNPNTLFGTACTGQYPRQFLADRKRGSNRLGCGVILADGFVEAAFVDDDEYKKPVSLKIGLVGFDRFLGKLSCFFKVSCFSGQKGQSGRDARISKVQTVVQLRARVFSPARITLQNLAR